MRTADVIVSPELVLVDPELAALVRATQPLPARWERPAAPTLAPPPRPHRRRPMLLALSVALNLTLLVSIMRMPPRDAPMIVETLPSAVAAIARAPVARPIVSGPAAVPAVDSAVLIRAQKRVLAGLAGDPKLRAAFVDPKTGLPWNGVGVRCRPLGGDVLACTAERASSGKHVSRTVHVAAHAG